MSLLSFKLSVLQWVVISKKISLNQSLFYIEWNWPAFNLHYDVFVWVHIHWFFICFACSHPCQDNGDNIKRIVSVTYKDLFVVFGLPLSIYYLHVFVIRTLFIMFQYFIPIKDITALDPLLQNSISIGRMTTITELIFC
jgi:hypothetical protein